ncbi:hypothetical protein KEM52_002498, partial [Ascosphaera acerosa]
MDSPAGTTTVAGAPEGSRTTRRLTPQPFDLPSIMSSLGLVRIDHTHAPSLTLDNPREVLTTLLSGHPFAIAFALLVALSLPVLLHCYLFRPSRRKGAPTFLLLGPSGAGKTKLAKRLEQKSILELNAPPTATTTAPPTTHTTQLASLTTCRLPSTVPLGSQFYRSAHDTTRLDEVHEYRLYDTPGHGKLRADAALAVLADLALTGKEPVKLARHVRDKVSARRLKDQIPLRGCVFMVDGAALASTAGTGAAPS